MIENGLAIAVNYRAGAGGNFLQNCLGLSRHCILRHRDWALQQLNYGAPDAAFYQQKLDWALTTLGPLSTGWLGHELGADTFIGFTFSAEQELTLADFPEAVHLAAQKGVWTTHTAHNYDYTAYIHRYWPTVRHVCVHGEQWADRWQPIKNPELDTGLEKTNWPLSITPEHIGFHFDMDCAMDSESYFLANIQNLYLWLEFDDFSAAPLVEFYRAYIDVHKNK